MHWLLAAPLDLDGELRMRIATAADIDALVTFNGSVHTSTPDGSPSPHIMARMPEWLNGSHPLIGPDDFLLVEETANRQIVSRLRCCGSAGPARAFHSWTIFNLVPNGERSE